MSEMTVIWTALPHGLTGDPANRRARLSVYVSMRLTGGAGTLADFPQALVWPTLLQPGHIEFVVQPTLVQSDGRSPGVAGNPTVAHIVSMQPDLALWSALFSADTPVTSYLPQDNDLTNRPINTHSVSAVHEQLRQGYQQLIGDSAVDLPTHRDLRSAFSDLHDAFRPRTFAPPLDTGARHRFLADHLFRPTAGSNVQQNVESAFAVARQLAETSAPGTFVPAVPHTGSVASVFAQLYAFHYRPPLDANNPRPAEAAVDPAKVLDFHQALQTLAQYPELLRRLGLVIDLEVPEARLPESDLDKPTGLVQIIPQFPSAVDFTVYSPYTLYVRQGDKIFAAAAQDAVIATPPSSTNAGAPEIVAGLLNLARPDAFDLVQIDVDGLANKVLNMVAAQAVQPEPDDGKSAGTPAISSAGVSLIRNGHGQLLSDRFGTAFTNNKQLTQNPSQPVTLFAEDLTRGLRVDVFDVAANQWHSLHQRIGRYVFSRLPGPPLEFADEGLSQPSAAQLPDAPPDIQAQLYIHESLMRWHGWNLAAPRPGKTITNAGPDTVTNQVVPGGFPLAVNFLAQPGTLPRLRFGGKYRFRVRAVDLAGNSLTLPEADELLPELELLTRPAPILPRPVSTTPGSPNFAHPDFTYRRFEPVLSPALVAREKFTEGESLERLVIRSNRGEPASVCAARLMALVAANRPQARAIYTGMNDRHVAPPKTSQLMAETYGLLDASFGTGRDFQQTYNIARKEKGRFSDTAIIDVVTGNAVPIPDTTGIDPLTGATITRPSVELVSPPRTVTVTVKTALGNSPAGATALFSYTDDPQPDEPTTSGVDPTSGEGPRIAAISPSHGPLAGGTSVRVTGSGFTSPAEVWFGDVQASQVAVVGDTLITAVSPPAPASFAVHHEPQLQLPYLPDPEARGTSLCGLPGVPREQSGVIDATGHLTFVPTLLPSSTLDVLGSLTQIDFGPNWPTREPFRLQLTEPDPNRPSGLPIWDSEHRVLTVFLPQGEESTVRLSSFLGPDDSELDKLGTWQFFVEQKAKAAQGGQPTFGDLQTAKVGGVWMVTPFRAIQLVHAVQQPLREPSFPPPGAPGSVKTPRDPGATFTYFSATVPVHGKSTAKLDLLASWRENVDRLDEFGPRTLSAQAHVFEVPIHLEGEAAAQPSGGQDDTVPIATYDPATDVVTFQAPPEGVQSGRKFLGRHEFGDTRSRQVHYQLVATTRFREYFPPEIKDVSRNGTGVTVHVPSSARPAAPDVLYAIPLFEWPRPTVADGSQVRTRKGGGVRVYLKRPWFSSGHGELLGVVLAQSADYPPNDRLRPYVTHWGNDPIWQSGPVSDSPRAEMFPRAVTSKGLLRLEEISDTVFVAGHRVDFNPDRQLWYCDIQIDTGQSYYPFVRLALARYQPHSLPGVELSRVVPANFVQLAPDRTVTVKPIAGDPNSFAITVEGLTYQRSAWDPEVPLEGLAQTDDDRETILSDLSGLITPPELIQVSVEQRIPGTQDDAGWEPAGEVADTVVRIDSAVRGDFPGAAPGPLWSGHVTLPSTRQAGQFRVVIREYERFPTDERDVETVDLEETVTFIDIHGHLRTVTSHERRTLTFRPASPATPTPRPGRMVFAETIEL